MSTTTDVQQPNYGRPDFGRPDYDRNSQKQPTVKLTAEETQAFYDCMKNSNVIVPPIISATACYGIFKATRFRANAKYAALVGGVIGLITGRVIASEVCLHKVASMPNSTLKERLIEAKYGYKPMSERQIFQSPDAASGAHDTEELSTGMVFDDYPLMNSYDTYSSFNDNDNISISEDTDLTESINLQKGTTYEELRHKNREDYYKKTKQYNASQTPETYPTTQQQQQQQQQRQHTSASTPMQEKTKYGDVWG